MIKQLVLILMVTIGAALMGGCISTRSVLVPTGEPVQLAEDVEAYVYVQVKGEKIVGKDRVVLPHGWWCLPDPGDE